MIKNKEYQINKRFCPKYCPLIRDKNSCKYFCEKELYVYSREYLDDLLCKNKDI